VIYKIYGAEVRIFKERETLLLFNTIGRRYNPMKSLLFALVIFSSLPALSQGITISGTMHHSALESGCWYLQDDDGKRFELIGDSGTVAPLRVEGQHIVVRAVPAKGTASICMMGEIVQVLSRIDTVRGPIDLVISSVTLHGIVHRTKSGVWYVKTTSGLRYEFKDTPEKKYQHAGMSINEHFRVLFDRKSTRENMNGVILPSSLKPMPQAKQKTYDPR
jgi:hypothetical protein